jgi:retinol dehydrogenase-12
MPRFVGVRHVTDWGTTGDNVLSLVDNVQALLQHNAKVYIAARNAEKAKQAVDDLKKETGKEALVLQLDLSNLHSIKAAAEEFTRCAIALFVFAKALSSIDRDVLSARRKRSMFCSTTRRANLDFFVSYSNNCAAHAHRGVMTPPIDMLTAQGYDLQFGTNVLGD